MAVAQQVPDEVWDALPPRRLPRGRVALALVVVVALAFGAYAASQAGLLAPNVRAASYGGSWEEGSDRFTTVTTLTNEGSTPTTIESISVSGTWARLDRVTNADLEQSGATQPSALPIELGPHEGMSIEVWLTVTDCAAITRSGLDLTAQATGPLGTTTIDITPAGQADPAAPSSYSWSGGTDPWNVPWPGTYASGACSTPLPPKP
ncbi:MAG: hypothetical protein AB7O74_00745 [Candidatus Nanopelagicales bacterium]